MEERRIFIVAQGRDGVRLDIWLTQQMGAAMSRSRIQQLIRAGLVTVNTRRAKESHGTKAGERIELCLPPPRPTGLKPENIPLEIIFEDNCLLVIDKPAGLVVHPAPGHDSGTLVNAVLHHCPTLAGVGGELRPGIAHRLDKDTSGVIAVAKTGAALASLAAQFKERLVHKEYLAIARGVLTPPNGTIRTMIGRHATDRKKMSAAPKKGRSAVTRYETLEKFAKYSLVRLSPETGRTHQIRVHLAHARHPVVGDVCYGRRSTGDLPAGAERQMLHAHKIRFRHPATGRSMEFSAPMPDDMARFLDGLRRQG
ncbi:MAG: RluA family pseudouridine synthase [Kiritimatiellae bacterium]|nr:RluA family pseudouridine synthase [Kiritimatiellia bacterium]